MDSGKTLERKPIYRGKVVDLGVETVELPGGRRTTLEVIRHPGAAIVVPVDDDGTVTLLRQYRHATGHWLLEAPAGKLDGDEAPEICARRELEEETGLRCRELWPLGSIWPAPGFANERIWIFLARGLSSGQAAPEDHEILTVERMPLDDAWRLALDGTLQDGKTICALARAVAALR